MMHYLVHDIKDVLFGMPYEGSFIHDVLFMIQYVKSAVKDVLFMMHN